MNRRKAKKLARHQGALELDQLLEWCAAINRENRCPRCEAPARYEPVDRALVPPSWRDRYADAVAGWGRIVLDHEVGCPADGADVRALEIARRFNFRYRARSYARMAVDGSAEQLFTRYERLPARGDPPVSPEHQLS